MKSTVTLNKDGSFIIPKGTTELHIKDSNCYVVPDNCGGDIILNTVPANKKEKAMFSHGGFSIKGVSVVWDLIHNIKLN